jgi:organic radical activating enzyme
VNNILERLEVHAVDHCNLSCIGCNHASPFFKKKNYQAEDYIPWIEKMRGELGLTFRKLAFTGGEPFLHPALGEFVKEMKVVAGAYECEIFTNLTWLKDESSIDKHAEVFSNVHNMCISRYKPVIEKIGGPELNRLMDVVVNRYPDMTIRSFDKGVVHEFSQVFFYEEARERLPHHTCAVKDCTQLVADGRLFRCTYGHAIGHHPAVSEGFAGSKDIVFDLKTDIGVRDINGWKDKWPLDACSHCGCGVSRDVWTPWVSDPLIRSMNREEYQDRLSLLVLEGK